jgi:Tol biopolymer transport system component
MSEQTPRRVRRRPHRRWQRVVLIVLGSTAVVLIASIVVIAVIVHRLNTPEAVPKSWRAPTVLPASTQPGIPAGSLVFDSNRTGNYEIWTMNANGDDERHLTDDRAYDSWWAQLSPNRRTILFYRTPRGTHDRDYSKTSLWAMAANGADQVELRPAGLDGWVYQGHAEWSPDGRRLVMFGGSRLNPQIWITNDLGGNPTEVTHRGGSNIDPSWAPDGRTMAFVGCPSSVCLPRDQEIYVIPDTGGAATRITYDSLQDDDPAFSHDGRELAWLTKVGGGSLGVGTWNIRLLPVKTTGGTISVVRGVHPTFLVKANGDAIDSKPAWSLNDKTIYFHRAVGGLKSGFQIWAINVNGSDLRELTKGEPGSNEYPGTYA